MMNNSARRQWMPWGLDRQQLLRNTTVALFELRAAPEFVNKFHGMVTDDAGIYEFAASAEQANRDAVNLVHHYVQLEFQEVGVNGMAMDKNMCGFTFQEERQHGLAVAAPMYKLTQEYDSCLVNVKLIFHDQTTQALNELDNGDTFKDFFLSFYVDVNPDWTTQIHKITGDT